MNPFEPAAHGVGIVHIGPGAFHRAHQAVYTEDAMSAEGGNWRILGVSMRSTHIADALTAQSGRYTLVTRGANGSRYRQVNAVAGALTAKRDSEAIYSALARPETRVVSLTVTEKAYHAKPGGVVDLLVHALAQRKEAGIAPFTALSCDNLAGNGDVLKRAVMKMAESRPGLAEWIAKNARFPATMVDRITPASTEALKAEVAAETGWQDLIPIETESFSQWVIEDDFADGRPVWEAAGAELVANVAPYERMKLRMLNGAHSMLAYAGHLSGKKYVRDVMNTPALADQVLRHMNAAATTLDPRDGLNTDTYRDALLNRFRNPHIAHETYQIAMDGSQKMPQRIFAPALEALHFGQELSDFAFATAVWARYLTGVTEDGKSYALRDPREAELTELPQNPDDRIAALFALKDLVPSALAADDSFRQAVTAKYRQLVEHGVSAALSETSHV